MWVVWVWERNDWSRRAFNTMEKDSDFSDLSNCEMITWPEWQYSKYKTISCFMELFLPVAFCLVGLVLFQIQQYRQPYTLAHKTWELWYIFFFIKVPTDSHCINVWMNSNCIVCLNTSKNNLETCYVVLHVMIHARC